MTIDQLVDKMMGDMQSRMNESIERSGAAALNKILPSVLSAPNPGEEFIKLTGWQAVENKEHRAFCESVGTPATEAAARIHLIDIARRAGVITPEQELSFYRATVKVMIQSE